VNTLQYFEICDRLPIAKEMLPLLEQYGLWYEIRETSLAGWQVYVPFMVNGRSHHFVNVSITAANILGAKYLRQRQDIVSLREALNILAELHTFYAKLETRVLIGDWRNNNEYDVLSKDLTDAELISLVLTRN
jgi:hypothetical protein